MKLLLKLAPHFLYICAILALLILLKQCGGERDQYKEERDKTHTLRRGLQDDTASLRKTIARQRQDSAIAAQKTQQHAKRADSIDKTRRLLEREIKSLYALLRTPYDTTIIDSTCCSLANQLVTANEAHRSDDSAKDAAMSMQLDLATERIDTLDAQLVRANNRFIKRDSIPIEAPKGVISGGVEASIGPVSQGGLWLNYTAPNGKVYGVQAGRQPLGWYFGGKLGVNIISFRKRK